MNLLAVLDLKNLKDNILAKAKLDFAIILHPFKDGGHFSLNMNAPYAHS